MKKLLSSLVFLMLFPAMGGSEDVYKITGTIGTFPVDLTVSTIDDVEPPPPPPVEGIIVYPGDNLKEKIHGDYPRPEIVNFSPGVYELSEILKVSGTQTLRALNPDAPKPVIKWTGGDSIGMLQAGSNSIIVIDGLAFDGQDGPTRAIRSLYAESLTIRNCDIGNCAKHIVDVTSGAYLLVENCNIHHGLRTDAAGAVIDAHGLVWIRTTDVTVRNCTFDFNTGDNIQQERGGDGDTVLIEDCTFNNSPLDRPVAGFEVGVRYGENGIDTKRGNVEEALTQWTIRRCVFNGWKETHRPIPAALNLKERVTGDIEDCTFNECYVAFRMRGKQRGLEMGPWTIRNCTVSTSNIAIRMEDGAFGIAFIANQFESSEEHYKQTGSPFLPNSITFTDNGFSTAVPTFPENVIANGNYVLE